MSYSGQELVEQEKCKLVYATFFDGVQCFDNAKGWLQLTTPEFQYNNYDAKTKTFSTNTFSVSPVTPTDLVNLQRPLITVSVDIKVSGLEVILTANQYEKKRIIPVYYLDECDSYSWDDELKICIDTYMNKVVTRVSFTTGELVFVTNDIFKYTDLDSVTKLYRLKSFDKQPITFEPDIEPNNDYFFPLAYYVEEIPASAERVIVHNYKYAQEFITYDKSLYPCGSTLSSEHYMNFDLIIDASFNSHINYVEASTNDWEFNITLLNSGYVLSNNQLDLDILFFNLDTGVYSTRSYRFDFYDKFNVPINLETAIDQENISFDEFIQQLGNAVCSGYFEVWYEGVYQENENRDLNRYGYPTCENLGVYSTDSCECEDGNLCYDKYLKPCEECNGETGVVTETCETWEICTDLGCKPKDTSFSACMCSSTDFGISSYPSVQPSGDLGTCKTINYESYWLDIYGNIFAKLPNGGPVNIIHLFNLNDFVTPAYYNYTEKDAVDNDYKTIKLMPFILLRYFNINYDSLDTELTLSRNITKDQIKTMIVEAETLVLDWFSYSSQASGAITTFGKPCNYITMTVHFNTDGSKFIFTSIRKGMNFILPNSIVSYSSLMASETSLKEEFASYCAKVKWLGSSQAMNEGMQQGIVPSSGELSLDYT